MPRWKAADLTLLRKLYGTVPNAAIGWLLDRSARSVATMGCRLGLRKSSSRLVEMGRQNVSRRWSACG